MKTICYKITFILLLAPLTFLGGNDFNGRYTKQKKINKEYNVSANALLEIDNSYGNIDISTWDQNRVEIEVIIKTNGNDEEAVVQRLKEIDVAFSNSQSKVSAKTLLEERNSSWWDKLFGGWNNVNIEINYRIKAPVTNNVDLNNDYGGISLDKLEGNAKISCDYGKLLIGELLGDNNQLNFDYTRNSQIGYIKRGKISADYSDFIVEEAGTIELSADYTDSHFEKVENISFECDYGSISLDKVRNAEGRGDYLNTKLGAVYNSVDLSLDYGSFSIEQLMKSAENATISSDYTSIEIGYDQETPFSFEIDLSYGNLQGVESDDFEMQKRNQSNSDNYYEGYHLSETAGANIKINSDYGNVKFVD